MRTLLIVGILLAVLVYLFVYASAFECSNWGEVERTRAVHKTIVGTGISPNGQLVVVPIRIPIGTETYTVKECVERK